METMDVLRQLVDDDTVTLSAATAATLFSSTDTSAAYKAVRIINNCGDRLYCKFQTSKSATATASTSVYSFYVDPGLWIQIDAGNSVGLSGYSAAGGSVRVEVFG